MDDAELLEQFEGRTLPFALWTHRCHVKVAYLHLRRDRFDSALQRLAAGIKAYNAANHRPDGPTQGYNQTTTQAMLHLIAATMQAYESAIPTPTADAFHVLRLFYSPRRQMDPRAKFQFVEPDLAPLPRLTR
jgi:hypothetical protein